MTIPCGQCTIVLTMARISHVGHVTEADTPRMSGPKALIFPRTFCPYSSKRDHSYKATSNKIYV